VIPPEFKYAAPDSLAEAIRLLTEEDGEVKPLAGGHSLLPLMKLRLATPSMLVDLRRIPGMRGIERRNGSFRVGALTRHAELASREDLGVVAQAAGLIADQQVRNRGTIGGSIAHADPAADYLPVMLALGATFRAVGPDGERTVPARDFVLGVMATVLAPSELLVEIELPRLPEGAGSAYLRLARLEGSFPIANAAAVADGDRSSLAVGGATPAPFLVDLDSTDSLAEIEERTRAAAGDAFGDVSATADYRAAMAGVYARRAVEAARAARRGG
jgi:carbon-monoxide dehydrogenase medium subunit